ncbi:MAG: zinc dependent phospholipase C family protein [Acetatifactor sp.]|nr:zinc dependent phospholipase C family protein [Acetatifactor sp.]
MPTTRAHFRHGEMVREKVKPEIREVIDKYPELFHFGVHGPDLLFYYDALKKNPVNRMGGTLHDLAGSYFFNHAVTVLEDLQKENSGDYKPSLAYVYGALCHFTLDVCCHWYVQEKMDESGVSHTEIEAEMDREILVREGKDPIRAKVTEHLVPSGKNARVVSRFYEGLTQEDIFKAMKDMVKWLDQLVMPSKVKRAVVFGLFRALGQYDDKKGLIINYERNEKCIDSTEKLIDLMEAAVDVAVDVINAFPEMDDFFRYNFISIDPETQEIFTIQTAQEASQADE